MDDTPNKPTDDANSAADDGINQADIDALMQGADPSGAETAPQGEDNADSQEVSQADIDSLLGGASAAADGGDDPSRGEDDTATADVNQSDIDALFADGGATVDGAGAGASEVGDGHPEDSAATPPDDTAPPPEPDTRVDTLGRPFDAAAAAMQAAIDAENAENEDQPAAPQPAAPAQPAAALPTAPYEPPSLVDSPSDGVDPKRVTMLSDVKLHVKIRLGKTRMLVEDVLKLGSGSVVELDKLAGDPVDVLINDRLVARGEVLVLNDNFCVRVSEVLSHDPHRITT